jgi:hypothetical protein
MIGDRVDMNIRTYTFRNKIRIKDYSIKKIRNRDFNSASRIT